MNDRGETSTCRVCKKDFIQPDIILVGFRDCCAACRIDASRKRIKLTDLQIDEKMALAGIDHHFIRLKNSEYINRATLISEEALTHSKPLFLFSNEVGTGKTLTLSVLARRLIECGTAVYFFHTGKLAEKCRRNNDYADRLSVNLQRSPAHVFFDDMGLICDKTGWFTAWLLSVLDSRYANYLPTSGSCNDLNAIEQRCLRRIMEPALNKEYTVIPSKGTK